MNNDHVIAARVALAAVREELGAEWTCEAHEAIVTATARAEIRIERAQVWIYVSSGGRSSIMGPKDGRFDIARIIGMMSSGNQPQ